MSQLQWLQWYYNPAPWHRDQGCTIMAILRSIYCPSFVHQFRSMWYSTKWSQKIIAILLLSPYCQEGWRSDSMGRCASLSTFYILISFVPFHWFLATFFKSSFHWRHLQRGPPVHNQALSQFNHPQLLAKLTQPHWAWCRLQCRNCQLT